MARPVMDLATRSRTRFCKLTGVLSARSTIFSSASSSVLRGRSCAKLAPSQALVLSSAFVHVAGIGPRLQHVIDQRLDERLRPGVIAIVNAALKGDQHIGFLARDDAVRKDILANAQCVIGADAAVWLTTSERRLGRR
jgi:hypothetical protein